MYRNSPNDLVQRVRMEFPVFGSKLPYDARNGLNTARCQLDLLVTLSEKLHRLGAKVGKHPVEKQMAKLHGEAGDVAAAMGVVLKHCDHNAPYPLVLVSPRGVEVPVNW